VAYVPHAKQTARLEAQDRICHEEFAYDTEANVYRCPAGRLLSPTDGRKANGNRIEIRYVSRKPDCDVCALRSRCLSAKTPTRTVYRWEHEAVLDRHRARMQDADAQMRRRAELAEHPFGTPKCRAGYRHFLVPSTRQPERCGRQRHLPIGRGVSLRSGPPRRSRPIIGKFAAARRTARGRFRLMHGNQLQMQAYANAGQDRRMSPGWQRPRMNVSFATYRYDALLATARSRN
jgi:hypothetical protein